MIKKIHTHSNGSECYAVGTYGRSKLTQAGIYRLNGEEVFMAYSGYSGSWYAFNTTDGREIASFRDDFFNKYLKSHKIAELTPEPNCVS